MQRAAAQADPVGYVADLPRQVVLEEVQRAPELFTALKVAVDARREQRSQGIGTAGTEN